MFKDWVCNKRVLVECVTILFGKWGVNKWKCVKWVPIFPKNWCWPPIINLHKVTTKNTDYGFEDLRLIFSRLGFLWILTKNRTRTRKILNLNHRLVLKDHSKWKANKNEHGVMLIQTFVLKVLIMKEKF